MGTPKRIAIVGAGISGLSTHYRLEEEAKRLGFPLEVETWDPKPQPGGTIGTHLSSEGYRCEQAAESILYSYPDAVELAYDVGLKEEIIPSAPAAKKRYVVFNGKLHAAPSGPVELIRGGFPKLSGLFRAAMEPFIARGPEDESVMDFGIRRLGREFAESLLDPMVTGVYAADPYRLSIRSGFPRIKALEMEHGSIVRGALHRMFGPRSTRRYGKGSFSFKGGINELVTAVQGKLHGPVRCNRPLTGIFHEGGQWRLVSGTDEAIFDQVVLALPACALSDIPGDLPAHLREEADRIPYNAVSVVCLAYDKTQVGHPVDGFGFVCPARENRRILGTLFSSALWVGAAPEGKVLFRTMVGGGRQPELARLSENELIQLVHEELSDLMDIHAEPVFHFVKKWEKGIPEYPVGHAVRLTGLRAELEGSGLWLAGNAWDGISLGNCVAASRPRATALLSALSH